VELLEVHEVVDADEEEPLAAPQVSDQRMLHQASVQLAALDTLRGEPDACARLVEQRQQLLDVGIRRSGDRRRDDRRLLLRPLARGVERSPCGQEAARRGGMSERLGDVPVLLPARRSEQPFREGAEHAFQLVSHRLLLGQDAGDTSLVNARANLAAQRLEPCQAPV
jgi:hypothetical protein